jgi:hypothetical protein
MPTRAERRHRAEQAKDEIRQRSRWRYPTDPTPRQVGRLATQHDTCACWQCTGEARHSRPDFDVSHPDGLYSEKP